MNCAIGVGEGYDGQVISMSHAQLFDCFAGVWVTGFNGSAFLTLNINNCLMYWVNQAFTANTVAITGNAVNCTIDGTDALMTMGSTTTGSFNFTNSIISWLPSIGTLNSVSLGGANNGFYNAPNTFGSDQTILNSSPYQQIWAGNHYLAPKSPFLTLGTTNIGAALLAQLQMKTTQAPQVLDSPHLTANTVLMPTVQRDITGKALGYHYDPVDYLGAASISNATLLLTKGVVLAGYDSCLFWAYDGSQIISQGTPTQRNYLVYYNAVQEWPISWLWPVSNAVAQTHTIVPQSASVFLRFTTICAPTGSTNVWYSDDNNFWVTGLTLQDSEIYGAGATWQMNEVATVPMVGWTNNLFHRVSFAVNSAATITSYNNLFFGTTDVSATNTTVSIHYRGGASPNTHENNVFDGVTAALDGTVGYNAYLHGATNTAYTNNNDIWTNLVWQGGPLGAYYQPTNSPLLNNGSTYATNLGLYHYTVLTNETVESNSIVSRGYHYIALASNGLPLDTNDDGIPDYLEDSNGNGVVDSGEIDWLVPGDLGLAVVITQPQPNSQLP